MVNDCTRHELQSFLRDLSLKKTDNLQDKLDGKRTPLAGNIKDIK